MRCLLVLVACAIASVPVAGAAQAADSLRVAEPAFGMGLPPRWLPYAGAFGTVRSGTPNGAGALIGVHYPILNPVTGLLGASAEIAGGRTTRDHGVTGRLLATVPALGFGGGVSWGPSSERVDALVTFQSAIRRGGLLGHGSLLRWDWLPARHTLAVGVQFPVMQPFAGLTRPRRATALVESSAAVRFEPVGLPDRITHLLASTGKDAALINAYVTLHSAADESTLVRAPVGYDAALRGYHGTLTDAFGAAAGDSARGPTIARRARSVVLADVVLAYDALFGQLKGSGAFGDLANAARRDFARWIDDSTALSAPAKTSVRSVFDQWLGVIGRVHHELLAQWGDSRLVWLPPQLALAPDEFDEQAEVDALIGRAVGHAFTDSNVVAYLRTADLPVEIARSIIAARTYHVLWTHDFAGRRPSGRLDQISYTLVADAYLPALTAAVQRYDSTGRLPQYTILLDAFYYHQRYGRLWMSVLEDPLNATVRLRRGEEQEATHVRQRLDQLRAAVARSSRLQRDAATRGGAAWLARLVRVNVNIILPSDFSFRSIAIVPPLPFTPDNVGRDHRKLVLTDFTESTPYAGELLVTGIGIGEHYSSATWEDRGYRIRGPAALDARIAVRRALEANGVRPDQIPQTLRETPPDRDGRIGDGPRLHAGRVLQVHNEPGFGAKASSVARAMLYSLAPPGSVIIAPDPLWTSSSWAAFLAAAAARGSTVVVIAPATANAPSPEPPVLALERDMLHRLLGLRHTLAARLSTEGGDLRIGLYAAHAPITDAAGRLAEVRAGLARAPWIRALIPFDAATLAELNRASIQAAPAADGATALARDDTPREPQLHQKTTLIARPGAIANLVRQPGWESVLAGTMRAQAYETERLADAIAAAQPPADTAAVRAADALLQAYDHSLSDADRKRLSFYFAAGSQNHDTRGLMLDAEASVVVSGFDASVGLVDLFDLMARTTWIERDEEVDRLVPPPGGMVERLAHLIRFAM
jgi:phosphatidylserine/phosphatidylglycerophosphate/cardiolipin synthase-like enzyme